MKARPSATSRRLKTRSAILGVALALVAPVLAVSPAWGLCPNCLGQNATLTPTLKLVGLFLLVPPAVFFLVVRAIRRSSESSEFPGTRR